MGSNPIRDFTLDSSSELYTYSFSLSTFIFGFVSQDVFYEKVEAEKCHYYVTNVEKPYGIPV
jgi:hypothetical protein